MQNKIIIGCQLDASKKKLYNHIHDFKKRVDSREKSLITSTKIYSLGWNDSFRLFLSSELEGSPTLNKLLISSINSINKTCPFALPLYFQTLTDTSPKLETVHSRISSETLHRGLKRNNDEFLQENMGVLLEALYKAGTTGCISTKQLGYGEFKPYTEMIEGFRTLCKIDKFFKPHFPTMHIEDCHIIPVAGAVVEVSEIHHILEASYNTKSKVVIIASSFSDDVANTLLVNWQQGKTNVIPFVLEDSLFSINEIKDVCSIAGVVPVSNETGIRLSSIALDDYSEQSCFYDSKNGALRIMLDYEGSLRATRSRMRLQDLLEKERVTDVRDILSERIARMSARNVSLHLQFDESEKGLIEDRVAGFFTYFSKCAQQGIIKMDEKYPVEYLPQIEAQKAIKRAQQDRKSIDNVKAILELEP